MYGFNGVESILFISVDYAFTSTFNEANAHRTTNKNQSKPMNAHAVAINMKKLQCSCFIPLKSVHITSNDLNEKKKHVLFNANSRIHQQIMIESFTFISFSLSLFSRISSFCREN